MMPVRLAMGLLVGWVIVTSAPAGAQEVLKVPEVRRFNLDFRSTPFRKALEQIFVPGGLRVKLEADVPPLPVTLALKEVDADTAFRLLFRQAKKLEPDLQFEPIDEGYRIFLGKPAQEEQANPYPITVQPKLPRPFAPPTPDFPVVQNREVEPLIADLLERAENGEPLLPMPKGTDLGNGLNSGDAFSPYSGGFAGGSIGGNGYGGNGYGGFGGGFGNFGGGLQPRTVDPYSSPLAGGLAVSDQISQRLYDRKKKPNPYFYNHPPQWILERRTVYWPNRRASSRRGGSGRKSPNDGNSGPVGGGYLPR